MKIKKSGARYSAIVGIGEKIKTLQQETGKEYLPLNRGVNSVCPIDLVQVVRNIDFNSPQIQVYPPNNGKKDLVDAINDEFFGAKTKPENIFVTHGGMASLDLVFGMLDIQKAFIAEYYWGAYTNIMKIRGIEHESYSGFDFLEQNPDRLKNAAVIICDPNNPLGDKRDDDEILALVEKLNHNGTAVIIDSPYRRLFADRSDSFYAQMCQMENVLILESFSKSLGLSGQRIGFVHSPNAAFRNEFKIRLLYNANGVNAFAQSLVLNLLATPEGKKAVKDFKQTTVQGIRKNIEFLKNNHLLASKFYQQSVPVGIFVVVNKSQDELLKHRIGSVSLSFFTRKKAPAAGYARICVSVPHKKFVEFFQPLAV